MARSVLPLSIAFAAILTHGCKKDEAEAPPAGPTTQKTSSAAGAPATALSAPPTVMAYGGTIGVNEAVTQAKALAAQAMPAVPPLEQMLAPQLQSEFRLKTADVIDLARPVRFAVFDPTGPDGQRRSDPLALVVGITGKDKLVAALPETGRKTGDAGNDVSYLKFEGATKPIYVNFIDGFAVFTRDPGIYGQHKAFLAELAQARLPGLGAVTIELEHLMARFGSQFERNLKTMRELVASASAAAQPGMGSAESMEAIFSWIQKSAGEADRVQLVLATQADGLTLTARLAAKGGSDLAKVIGELKGKADTSLLANLPATTTAFMNLSIDSAAMARFSSAVNQMFIVGPVFGADAEKAKPYLAAMDAYVKAIDGRMLLGAWTAGTDTSMAALFGVTDAAAIRAAQKTLVGLYADPAAQAYYQKLGMTMTHQAAAYSVGAVPVDIITTQLGAEGDPQTQMVMQMMGDFLTQHIGVGDKLGVMAYGKEAKPVVEGLLAQKLGGKLETTPAAKRALASAAPNHFLLGWINPIAFGRNLKLGGMNPLATALAGVEATSGLGLSLGVDGGELALVIDVPAQLMKEGAAAAQKAMGSF